MVMLKINNRKAAPKIASSIDIHCEIQAVPFAQLSQMQPGEPSASIRERVIAARKIQEERFKPYKGIASSRWPAPLPTLPVLSKYSPCTLPKPSGIVILTAVTGQSVGYRLTNLYIQKNPACIPAGRGFNCI